MRELFDIRREKGYRQEDLAEKLGLAQSTYAYREKNGGFTEDEKKEIAKILKIDMTTVSWTKPAFQTVTNSELEKLKAENAALKQQVELLKELLLKLNEKK